MPLRALSALALLAAALVPDGPAAMAQEPPADGRGDAVVVAVIDSAFPPYHWNYLAAKMPQAQDGDPSNDLPLATAPDQWLPGFPHPDSFGSYEKLGLTLDATNASRSLSGLRSTDNARWSSVRESTESSINYYWIPGTKVVGLVDFDGTQAYGPPTSHGAGTSSVSVGNLHGTCPECLLVFISYEACPQGDPRCPEREHALDWAMNQPWIDVITNSYGFSTGVRDRIYDGSDTAMQRNASERGQTIFFSAGNGQANDFVVPNTTLFSSQEGPDYVVTVSGSDSQDGATMSGAGKPADVTAPGESYPAIGGSTVSSSGTFGGTSNATPVVAGMYARALYTVRRALPGPSRVQEGGVIAVERPSEDEEPFACAQTRAACELGDGALTAGELRTRLLHGAVHTPGGLSAGGVATLPATTQEMEFLAEGHGTYEARLRSNEVWQQEEGRIIDPMLGTASPVARPAGELEWMITDSFCRQRIWRSWSGGYYREGHTAVPAASPDWPLRTALVEACRRGYAADELPNLVPLPPADVGLGEADPGTSGTALRFSVSTANRGLHGLELSGQPDGSAERQFVAYQCVTWSVDRVCETRRPVGRFAYHEEHLHYHFQAYAKYELRRLRDDGAPDMTPAGLAVDGGKVSFCLLDYDQDRPAPNPIYSVPHPLYLTCSGGLSGAGIQGISPYWRDTYVRGLDGQQILIDGVPDGRYALVIVADPDDRLYESNEADNVSFTTVEISEGDVRPV